MRPTPSASMASVDVVPVGALNIERLTSSCPDHTAHLLADRELFAELKSDGARTGAHTRRCGDGCH
ncbi:hypothetical protein ACIGMX_39050 [Streptomyces aquilus]|uniref:hypothetical protein n=1 Tax=Streptomyces aquilus TaxID=2548456 RepID=UPI0037CE04B6